LIQMVQSPFVINNLY